MMDATKVNYNYLDSQIESCLIHHIKLKNKYIYILLMHYECKCRGNIYNISVKEVFLLVCICETSFYSYIQMRGKTSHPQTELQETKQSKKKKKLYVQVLCWICSKYTAPLLGPVYPKVSKQIP